MPFLRRQKASPRVIFELGQHNLLSALALKSQFESVVRDKTRIKSFQVEFTKKILFVCDDYSEIASPVDLGFFSSFALLQKRFEARIHLGHSSLRSLAL